MAHGPDGFHTGGNSSLSPPLENLFQNVSEAGGMLCGLRCYGIAEDSSGGWLMERAKQQV